MSTEVSYSYARNNLARVLDEAESALEPVIIKRRNHPDMVILSSSEYAGLEETAHLLRSPKNAQRLLAALSKAYSQTTPPMSIDELKKEVGL